jgi:hypothetical protein
MLIINGSGYRVSKRRFTRAVSLPIPPLPPVTMTVFPVWSGTSAVVQVGLGGNNWLTNPMRFSDMAQKFAAGSGGNRPWRRKGSLKDLLRMCTFHFVNGTGNVGIFLRPFLGFEIRTKFNAISGARVTVALEILHTFVETGRARGIRLLFDINKRRHYRGIGRAILIKTICRTPRTARSGDLSCRVFVDYSHLADFS